MRPGLGHVETQFQPIVQLGTSPPDNRAGTPTAAEGGHVERPDVPGAVDHPHLLALNGQHAVGRYLIGQILEVHSVGVSAAAIPGARHGRV